MCKIINFLFFWQLPYTVTKKSTVTFKTLWFGYMTLQCYKRKKHNYFFVAKADKRIKKQPHSYTFHLILLDFNSVFLAYTFFNFGINTIRNTSCYFYFMYFFFCIYYFNKSFSTFINYIFLFYANNIFFTF